VIFRTFTFDTRGVGVTVSTVKRLIRV
jgi:hypothetical protein